MMEQTEIMEQTEVLGGVLFRSFRLFRPLSSSSRFHGEVVTNETEATKEQKECVPSAEWRRHTFCHGRRHSAEGSAVRVFFHAPGQALTKDGARAIGIFTKEFAGLE
jgi:hypothetical protein